MKEIVLIGGGGHCESVIDVIEQSGEFSILGIVDKDLRQKDELGYPILGDDSALPELAESCPYAMVTVGHIKSSELRMMLFHKAIGVGFSMPSIVSPRAYVARHVEIGMGTIIMHDALINANATVGINCIINSKSLIEHGASIKDHCHISTNAVVNGGVLVSAGSFVGSGAVIRENFIVEPGSFIKAGSIVK